MYMLQNFWFSGMIARKLHQVLLKKNRAGYDGVIENFSGYRLR